MPHESSRPDATVRPPPAASDKPVQESGVRARIDLRGRLGNKVRPPADPRALPVPFVGVAPPPPAPSPPRSLARTLTVTVGADVEAARARSRRAVVAAAIVAALPALGLGYLVGTASLRAADWNAATEDAHALAQTVDAENDQLAALSAQVTELSQALAVGNVAPGRTQALAAVSLEVDAQSLALRRFGALRPELQRALVEYAVLTHAAREHQARLVVLLGPRGRGLAAIAARHERSPEIHWAVALEAGPHGAVARVLGLAEPLRDAAPWPREVQVRSPQGLHPATRLDALDGLAAGGAAIIPIAAESLGPIEAMRLTQVARDELRALHTLLEGDGDEAVGLRHLGRELVAALQEVGTR